MIINCYMYLYLATGDKKNKNKIKLNDIEMDVGFNCCIQARSNSQNDI